MKMERKSIAPLVSFIVCGFLLSGCGAKQQQQANKEYKVITVSLGDKSLSNNYSASITGSESVEIRPQLSGMLTQVSVKEGARVKKGETLFIIDQTPYKAELQRAKANVESARASVATAQLTFDSKRELFNANVVSQFDLQTAQNALDVAKATLAQALSAETIASNNLSYTVIKSPVTGSAGMTAHRIGSLVNPSMVAPLIVVSNDTQMYTYFSMTEKQLLDISRQGGALTGSMDQMPPVRLKLSDATMYDTTGIIDAISGVVDPSTGAIAIRAVFPNPKGVLRSGGTGTIVFPYQKKDCMIIPQGATYELQDKLFVYKVVDGKAVSSAITVFGVDDGKDYIVESGLEVGDVIISEGAGLVREGAEVVVSNEKKTE